MNHKPEIRDSRCFSRRDAWSHGAFRSAGAVSKRYCPEEREDPWPNDRGEWGISNRGVRVETLRLRHSPCAQDSLAENLVLHLSEVDGLVLHKVEG